MRNKIFDLFALTAIAASPCYAKYERALVFQGGGFQTSVFLGILEGVKSSGYQPDVILSTCGSSIAAAVINAFPNAKDQRAFIESRRFYEFLKSVQFTQNSSLTGALSVAAGMRSDASAYVIPDLFGKFLLNVPQHFGIQELDRPFSTSDTRFIMVGSRVRFDRADVGRKPKDTKWFSEVFFTDAQTARLLDGFKSPVAALYPKSTVHEVTETVTEITAAEAARASVADPHYLEPKKFQNATYMTGAIDLYPNEAAREVAEYVVEVFSTGFDTIVEQPAIASTFHYDNNDRLRYVNDQYADYWIDLSDFGDQNKNFGLNPKLSLSKLKVQSGVPADYSEYLLKVNAEWHYGRQRGLEAFAQPGRNNKAHIRKMDDANSSQELRRQRGAAKFSPAFY